MLGDAAHLERRFRFANAGATLCVFRVPKDDQGYSYRIEVQRPSKKQQKVVLTLTEIGLLFPSPDNKLVAFFGATSDWERLFLVNADGEIVAAIPLEH